MHESVFDKSNLQGIKQVYYFPITALHQCVLLLLYYSKWPTFYTVLVPFNVVQCPRAKFVTVITYVIVAINSQSVTSLACLSSHDINGYVTERNHKANQAEEFPVSENLKEQLDLVTGDSFQKLKLTPH